MRLRAEVIDLGGLDVSDDLKARRGVGEVAVVQVEVLRRQPVKAVRVEGARAPHDAVHFVALAEEKLSEVGSVLTSDPSDERHAPLRRVMRPVGIIRRLLVWPEAASPLLALALALAPAAKLLRHVGVLDDARQRLVRGREDRGGALELEEEEERRTEEEAHRALRRRCSPSRPGGRASSAAANICCAARYIQEIVTSSIWLLSQNLNP